VVHEHHGAAVSQPLVDGGVKRAARRLLEPGPRLVEHQEPRPGQQRLGDRHLLAHALR